jgi:hypothetical protein
VELDFLVNAPTEVIVTLELIHIDEGESVEWSARVGPLTVIPGREVREEEVPLGRGPLPNLLVTSVAIGEHPTVLFIGDETELGASREPEELPGAQTFWGALDPGITITIVDPVQAVDFLSVDGDGQQAPVGTVVPQPIRVQAYDDGENLLRGVPITVTVTAGGGSLAGATNGSVTVITNANGDAVLPAWTLGTTMGTNTLDASVAGKPNVRTTISATGIAGPAASIAPVSGNDQAGSAGQTLAQPLVARVADQFGNPVAGVRVDFATTGGGTLAPAADTSDTAGLVGTRGRPASRA